MPDSDTAPRSGLRRLLEALRRPQRTQAVVAVALKHQLGTKPWPVCG